MRLVDSHCHLDLLGPSTDPSNVDFFIQRARENYVNFFLNVCINLKEFPQVLKTAQLHENVWSSVGLHPNELDEQIDVETLLKLGLHDKVIAIGETGLDYYRTKGEVEWQRERFRVHIQAAKQLKKPLIVHTRAAKEDTMKILQEEKAKDIGGVMHCFTEDWDMAKLALEMNFYISFSGIVTFKNAKTIQDVAKLVPLNRLLIETDSPYLAPLPYRGKPNEPSYLIHTAEFLAHLKNISLNELAEKTTENFFKLFSGASKNYV